MEDTQPESVVRALFAEEGPESTSSSRRGSSNLTPRASIAEDINVDGMEGESDAGEVVNEESIIGDTVPDFAVESQPSAPEEADDAAESVEDEVGDTVELNSATAAEDRRGSHAAKGRSVSTTEEVSEDLEGTAAKSPEQARHDVAFPSEEVGGDHESKNDTSFEATTPVTTGLAPVDGEAAEQPAVRSTSKLHNSPGLLAPADSIAKGDTERVSNTQPSTASRESSAQPDVDITESHHKEERTDSSRASNAEETTTAEANGPSPSSPQTSPDQPPPSRFSAHNRSPTGSLDTASGEDYAIQERQDSGDFATPSDTAKPSQPPPRPSAGNSTESAASQDSQAESKQDGPPATLEAGSRETEKHNSEDHKAEVPEHSGVGASTPSAASTLLPSPEVTPERASYVEEGSGVKEQGTDSKDNDRSHVPSTDRKESPEGEDRRGSRAVNTELSTAKESTAAAEKSPVLSAERRVSSVNDESKTGKGDTEQKAVSPSRTTHSDTNSAQSIGANAEEKEGTSGEGRSSPNQGGTSGTENENLKQPSSMQSLVGGSASASASTAAVAAGAAASASAASTEVMEGSSAAAASATNASIPLNRTSVEPPKSPASVNAASASAPVASAISAAAAATTSGSGAPSTVSPPAGAAMGARKDSKSQEEDSSEAGKSAQGSSEEKQAVGTDGNSGKEDSTPEITGEEVDQEQKVSETSEAPVVEGLDEGEEVEEGTDLTGEKQEEGRPPSSIAIPIKQPRRSAAAASFQVDAGFPRYPHLSLELARQHHVSTHPVKIVHEGGISVATAHNVCGTSVGSYGCCCCCRPLEGEFDKYDFLSSAASINLAHPHSPSLPDLQIWARSVAVLQVHGMFTIASR